MLEVKNLVRVYRPKKGNPVKALDGVSLRFPDTGMIFILGKSGSGKSTLLNVMGGLDRCDSGEIIIKGKSSADFKQDDFDSYRNTYLGFIFQEYNILTEFTVGVNIGLALQLQGRKATSEEINSILEEVDLQGYGNRKPNELSGGQKQRVAIARALVKNPQIIMADEPTGALDSATGLQVFDTLKKLSKDKLVIVVTHDRDFAEQYGDRVIELKDGKVISDISKYQIISNTSDNNLIVTDKVIQVKKGYTLTSEDLDLINKILANDDAIISFDAKLNDGLRNNAKLDDKGNRESFKDTDNSKVVSENDENFKLIKSRLPAKHMFKMGSSSLKNKPFRLVVTIFLSLIAFAMFGLADTISAYDQADTLTNSFLDSNIPYVSFTKAIRKEYKMGNYNDTDINMTEDDFDKLSTDTGLEYLPVYNLENTWLQTSKGTETPYYKSKIVGFCEIDGQLLDKFGFSIIGNLPQADDEIAITKYIYSHYSEYGYTDLRGTVKAEDIKNEVDFLQIEPTLLIANKAFKITGIIDDKFNEERYAILKESNNYQNFTNWMLADELEKVTTYGTSCLIYVNKNTISSLILQDDINGISINNFGNIFFDNSYIDTINSFQGLQNSGLPYTYFGESALKNNEVIVSFNNFKDVLHNQNYDFEKFNTFYDSKLNDYFNQYVIENYQSAYDKGFGTSIYFDYQDEEEITEEEKIQLYKNFLISNPKNNEFGLNYYEILSYYEKIVVEEYLAINPGEWNEYLTNITLTINDYTMNDYNEYTDISIKGFIYNKDYSAPFIVCDSIFNNFEMYTSGNIAFAISPVAHNAHTIKDLAKYNYGQPSNNSVFCMRNEVTYILDRIDNILTPLAKVFLYIGLGLAFFAAIMLMNYISTSISYKKREIGILRAVGARGTDVFGIFFSESLLIALINFILAVAATIIVVFVINTKLRTEYGLLLTFLNFGIRQVVLMLGVSLFVAFAASFTPVMRIARKKPIDAINNR